MKHSFFLATLVLLFASLQRTVAQDTPVCEDNPNFKYKNKKNKDCDWVANGDGKWRNKWCMKKAVKLLCPETCEYCDKLDDQKPPKDVCPKIKKDKTCHKYEPGLECGYSHVWKGCNTAEMKCMPTYESTCDPNSLWWITKPFEPEICEPFPDDRPYGEKCKTDSCPPVAPESGDTCLWYTNQSEDCDYDYVVAGCKGEPKTCTPTKWATCDSISQTWSVAVAKVCSDGTTCDPDTYFEGCPQEKPTDGSDCGDEPSGDKFCVYEHSVGGCGNNPECRPVSRFYCKKNGKWKEVPDKRPKCLLSEGCPRGECDPDDFDPTCSICPYEAPAVKTPCGKTPEEGCSYDYSVAGCTPEQIECRADSTYYCGDDGFWEIEYDFRPKCKAPEGCPWGECDPYDFDNFCNLCPDEAPEPETPCEENSDEGCSYDYSVSGCTPEEIQCSPDSTYYCNDGFWEVEYNYRPEGLECVPPEPCPSGECDPDDFDPTCDLCPATKPTEGEKCRTPFPFEEGCVYEYSVGGCGNNPECLPVSTFYCGDDGVWVEEDDIRPKCLLAPGCPKGECDPDNFDRTCSLCPGEKPEEGTDCETPFPFEDACVYEYSVGGCGNNPECRPVSYFYCNEEGEVWKEVLDKRPKCLLVDGCPEGECDPDDFDPTCSSCPYEAPEPGTPCDETADEGCSYEYSVAGCTPDELECRADSTYYCGAEGLWEVEYDIRPKCIAPEGCPWGECDPNDFDPTCKLCPYEAPEPETLCDEIPDDGCSYDYSVSGCTVDDVQCSPDSTYTCGADGLWEVEYYYRPACVAPEGCPWGECDPEDFDPTCDLCPDKKPKAGKKCKTPFPFEDACVYEYSVGGCKGSLECRPVSYFYCNEKNDKWKEVPDKRKKCGIPKGCPRGECDPDDFDPGKCGPKPKSFLV
jgi:hypothetical protein